MSLVYTTLLLRFEPRKKALRHFEQMRCVEAVDTLAPAFLHLHEPRLLEDTQMTRGRGPRTSEALGNLSSRQGAAAKAEDEQDMPSRSVRKSAEDPLQGFELFSRGQGA